MRKFVIKKSSDGQFYFNLKAVNGEIILTSERYTTKQNCQNGIESVKTNSTVDGNYDRRIADNEQFYFVLKADNGEIIGKSEMYTSIQARENGISSVKTNAPNAEIIDES